MSDVTHRLATDGTLNDGLLGTNGVAAKIAQIHNDANNIHGDAANIHGDLVTIRSDTSNIHSDLGNIHSDLSGEGGLIDTLDSVDDTLGDVYNKINSIDSSILTLKSDNALGKTGSKLDLLGKDATLATLGKDATLATLGKDATLATLGKDATLQAIASILASVKSVNGKYGIVVLDSGDILISKNTQGSKTTKQVLTELQDAVDNTPLTFTVSEISGQTGKYKIVVTTGTPS